MKINITYQSGSRKFAGDLCFYAFVCLLLQAIFLSSLYASEKIEKSANLQGKSEADFASFRKGYELFEKEEYKKAAPLFYDYLKSGSPEERDHNWAEFFLGVSIKKSGFTHASVDVLSHLIKNNPDPKIVQYVFEMFDSIARSGPFNRELLVREAISGRQYAYLEGVTADFVNYYQGNYDWENGFIGWGEENFNKIKKNTFYYYKSLYKQALYSIYNNRIDDAVSILREIRGGTGEAEEIQDDVLQTLARLLYERGDYEESLKMYQEIDKPMRKQARNLLERAWNHFRLGNPEKAMGLLYTYSSPAFKSSFTAEFFLLKSLIYKSVCHYKSALEVVSEFRKHYSDSLRLIYSRGEPEEDISMLGVLLKNQNIKEIWELIGALEKERERVDFKDEPLREYVLKSYDTQIDKSSKILRGLINQEYEKIADQLLHYEEKASLMEYEIGIDISQRVTQFHYDDEKKESEPDRDRKRVAVYPFQGEFWSDELADYRVELENRCSKKEEWDIFLN